MAKDKEYFEKKQAELNVRLAKKKDALIIKMTNALNEFYELRGEMNQDWQALEDEKKKLDPETPEKGFGKK